MGRPVPLDTEWLTRLGAVDLDEADLEFAVARVHSAIQLAVGTRIVRLLTARQLDEFEALQARQGADLGGWLDERVPSHRDIVREERALLEAVIRDDLEGFTEAVKLSRAAKATRDTTVE